MKQGYDDRNAQDEKIGLTRRVKLQVVVTGCKHLSIVRVSLCMTTRKHRIH